jgi:hypothetical protein
LHFNARHDDHVMSSEADSTLLVCVLLVSTEACSHSE